LKDPNIVKAVKIEYILIIFKSCRHVGEFILVFYKDLKLRISLVDFPNKIIDLYFVSIILRHSYKPEKDELTLLFNALGRAFE
jgi:hypothetical protein